MIAVVNIFSTQSPTADEATFVSLASLYASSHPSMSKDVGHAGLCGDSQRFPGGITNGAEWYATQGSMQVREDRYLVNVCFGFGSLNCRISTICFPTAWRSQCC